MLAALVISMTAFFPGPGPGLNEAVQAKLVERWNATVAWNEAVAANAQEAARKRPPAHVSPARTRTPEASSWDGVAACESGGNWGTNTGNGYYGGLQMTPQFWKVHGGLAYAPRPDLASRDQQIAVADRAGSRSPWPTCGGR